MFTLMAELFKSYLTQTQLELTVLWRPWLDFGSTGRASPSLTMYFVS
jgi:hypothetical protein